MSISCSFKMHVTAQFNFEMTKKYGKVSFDPFNYFTKVQMVLQVNKHFIKIIL